MVRLHERGTALVMPGSRPLRFRDFTGTCVIVEGAQHFGTVTGRKAGHSRHAVFPATSPTHLTSSKPSDGFLCMHSLAPPGPVYCLQPIHSLRWFSVLQVGLLGCYATHMVFSSPFSPPLQLQPNRSATKYNEIFLGRTYVNGLNRKVPLSLALLNSLGR